MSWVAVILSLKNYPSRFDQSPVFTENQFYFGLHINFISKHNEIPLTNFISLEK